MTDLTKGSLESDKSTIAHTIDLLTHYSFDLGNYTVTQLLDQWLQDYPASWVRLAVIEALYQGRYKAVSVGQILQFWQRRDQPLHRFNYEFERLVCNKFPRNLNPPLQPAVGLALPADPTVLPVLPVAQSAATPELPAWTALAVQIHQETATLEPALGVSEDLAASQDRGAEPDPQPHRHLDPAIEAVSIVNGIANGTPASSLPPVAPLDPSLSAFSSFPANVETLINDATSSLNASTAAITINLQTQAEPLVPPATHPLAETCPAKLTTAKPSTPKVAPPPVADFCAKLKAVVEQNIEGEPDRQ